MSFMSTFRTGEGIEVRFIPGTTHEFTTDPGSAPRIADRINIDLAGTITGDATLSLSIDDARALLAALPGVLAQHEAREAERSAAAVGEAA